MVNGELSMVNGELPIFSVENNKLAPIIFFILTFHQNFKIMFLKLNHQKLDIYSASREVVCSCYQLTNNLPPEERFSMISQIRRAALSVHLNISEGASRKSFAERKRFYEVARGSLIEIDAALDIADNLGYLKNIHTPDLGEKIVKCFKLLSGMMK